MVKVKDIGRALDSVQDDKFTQRYVTKNDDKICIVIAVQRLPGTNTVQIVKGVKKVIEEIRPQLPQSLTIEPIYDQSDSINEEVAEVELTLIVAFILVVAVIYLFLGKALNTIIPILSLPLSAIGTFAVMYLFGFTIDILSLLAITLSIGFLVDDAIVVLENNVRHAKDGEKPLDAALNSAKEISMTVLSMTLCLTAAFIPMLFMGGVIGRLFRECAVTIIVAVLFSGLISLTLTPMVGSRLIRPNDEKRKTRMERISDTVNDRLKKMYEPCLHWAMKHRFFMIGLGLSSIVFSVILYRAIPQDLLPPDDIGYIEGFTQARDGTSPFLMEKYHRDLSQIGIKDPNIESIISISSYSNSNQGILFIKLKPFKERQPMNQVIVDLTKKYSRFSGVNTFLSPPSPDQPYSGHHIASALPVFSD